MPEIAITFNEETFEAVKKMVENLPVKKQNQVYYQSMINAAASVETKLKENISGPILKVRTGYLRHSMSAKIFDGVGIDGISALIGSGVRYGERVKYADILEEGGIIRPKKAKYLAIPIGEAKTKSGVARGRPRDFANTFIRKGIIFQKYGKNSIRPLFLLRKSVTIPAFRYMGQTAEQQINIVEQSVLKAINQVENGDVN